jgi:hypothetical protein
MTSNGNDKRKF